MKQNKTMKLYLVEWICAEETPVCVTLCVCVCTCVGCGLHPPFELTLFSFQISDLQSTSWLCQEERNADTTTPDIKGKKYRSTQAQGKEYSVTQTADKY